MRRRCDDALRGRRGWAAIPPPHTASSFRPSDPTLAQDVYFGNHWSLEGVSRKKSDICRAIGAGLLIDDNPVYAWDCAQVNIPLAWLRVRG